MTTVVAEIPTESAALAFADQLRELPSLEALFAMLEGAGISIGIEGRLRVFVLLARLSSLGVQLDDRASLLPHLLPVLAGSAHEQDEIGRLVEKWSAPEKERGPDPAASGSVISTQVEQLERVDRGSRWVVIGVAIAIVLLLLGIAAMKLSGGAPPTDVATDVAGASHPVISIGFGVNPFWKPYIEDGLSRLAFAAVVLIAGLCFGAWRREARGRLVRQVGDTDLVSRFRLVAKAPRWFRTIDARTAFDRLKRVRWRDTDNIDPQQTILKTIRGGGRPTIEYKRLRELPNYVLLIDRSARDDYAGLFARAIEGALIDARIVYSRYDFSGVPDRLNPVRGGEQSDIVDAEYLPFSVVASRHAGERLLLVGTGTEFFEVPGIRVDRSGRRSVVPPGTPLPGLMHIREFASASLITSAPVSAWGDNERQLAELGFAIFPAEVKGIEDLATRIIAGPEASEPPPVRSALPGEDYILKRLDRYSQRFMSEVPPHREEIDQVVGFLKAWAGPREVYTLLAAIAAFPKIDPEFTFVLAKLILTSSNGEIDSALFGRLIRLPWIRDGYMPDWLRIAIINGLQEDERDAIRRVQASMMKHVETVQDEPPALDELVATFEVARQLAHGQLNELTARIMGKTGVLAADERIFFSVLNEEALDPIDDVIRPEAPEIVADRMDRLERRRRFWMRAMVLGVAVLAAWTQPWLWRVLTDGPTPFKTFEFLQSSRVGHIGFSILAPIAIYQWLFNVLRSEPKSFTKVRFAEFVRRPFAVLKEWLLAPGIHASYALIFALVSTEPVLVIAAAALMAWVWLTPEQWWNPQSAETMLPVQLQRDVVTGSLGTLAVITVWTIPWFHGALPLLLNTKSSIRELVLAAIIGAAGLAASTALMRRWVIGKSSTFLFHRCWLEFGFGGLTALLMAASAHCSSFWGLDFWNSLGISALSIAAYYLAARSTLGITQKSLVWRLTLNTTLAGIALTGITDLASLIAGWAARPERRGRMIDELLFDGAIGAIVALGIVMLIVAAVVFMRRSNAEIASRPFPTRQILLFGTIYLIAIAQYSASLVDIADKFSDLFGTRGQPTEPTIFFWPLTLPALLLFWPILRLLGRVAQPANASPMPWWRAVAESPWWAVPAMWLAAIGWHFGDVAFSVWPLALPIAVAFAWKNGRSATAAIAVGTLPLLLRLGDGDNIYWTPGGVWPALAVMFWARFVRDEPFRQRLLRRESLSWPEGYVLVLLLIAKADFQLPPNGMMTAAIHLDPSWMLVTVAMVVGASRMPRMELAKALVIVPTALLFLDTHYVAAHISIDIVGCLLLLYAARAWRRYAATAVNLSPKDPASGLFDRRIFWSKNSGPWVGGVALYYIVWLIVVGWNPDARPAPVGLGVLALITITGLISANLWIDRFKIYPRLLSYIPVNQLYVVILFFAAFSPLALLASPNEQTRLFDLKPIGLTVCFVVFLAFGLTIRIAAERRSGESWRDTTRRIWRAPQDPGGPAEISGIPGSPPDRDEDFKRAVA
jgi:hypothetical protein